MHGQYFKIIHTLKGHYTNYALTILNILQTNFIYLQLAIPTLVSEKSSFKAVYSVSHTKYSANIDISVFIFYDIYCIYIYSSFLFLILLSLLPNAFETHTDIKKKTDSRYRYDEKDYNNIGIVFAGQ